MQVKTVCIYKVVHAIIVFTKCLKPLLEWGKLLKAYLFSAIERLTPSKILAFLYSISRQEEVSFTFLDISSPVILSFSEAIGEQLFVQTFGIFLPQKLLH